MHPAADIHTKQLRSSKKRHIALVLAAGESVRMGRPKALLSYGPHDTFLSHLHRKFRNAGYQVVIVAGAHRDSLLHRHPEYAYVYNSNWRAGQFASVLKGLSVVLLTPFTSLLLHPVDAPKLPQRLLARMQNSLRGHEVVIPRFRGQLGHPVLLSRKGAEKILRQRHRPSLREALQGLDLVFVKTTSPDILLNINTPKDYKNLWSHQPRKPKKRNKP